MQNALVKGMGATDPCTQPGAWVVMKQGDKYYSVCMFTGDKYEVDEASAISAGYLTANAPGTGGTGSGSQIVPGVSNTVLLAGVAAVVLVPMIMGSRY